MWNVVPPTFATGTKAGRKIKLPVSAASFRSASSCASTRSLSAAFLSFFPFLSFLLSVKKY
jgi:hypothetical protein